MVWYVRGPAFRRQRDISLHIPLYYNRYKSSWLTKYAGKGTICTGREGLWSEKQDDSPPLYVVDLSGTDQVRPDQRGDQHEGNGV